MDNKKQKVMVIGAAGMLGGEVVSQLLARGYDVVQTAWPDNNAGQILLDITDQAAVNELVAKVRPVAVYNCSAFTDVDGAESREDIAAQVNGTGVGTLAGACRENNSLLIHVSTDYVFNGASEKPYRCTDPVSPQTAYGRTKLIGEQKIQEIANNWIIVRTSWLYGSGGKNFVDTIVSLARQKENLKVVSDQLGCPTYAPDLARCLIDLAQKGGQGMYHFCNGPACSWFDFARKAVEISGGHCLIEPCTTDEFPRPAKRPAYSVLDCQATFEKLGWTARPWPETLLTHFSV
ncbi:MAG: dTDP-4-dehydrorhamnose reductase [Phycisphaerae bacterium]|nr:dTDP-4-dehydrorhamnose reductase [Phycisphaerae bacterium]